MYSTLRPEGLASGSAKASVAMEANKIRADFMTTVAIWQVFFWFFEKMATSSWFLEAGICLEWRTQVEIGKRTLLSFSNKSSHELTVRNVQSYQIKVSLNYEKKPNCFYKCHFIHKCHRIEVITLCALNVLIHVAAGVRLTWKLDTLNWHAISANWTPALFKIHVILWDLFYRYVLQWTVCIRIRWDVEFLT